jgi:hypothetical protein
MRSVRTKLIGFTVILLMPIGMLQAAGQEEVTRCTFDWVAILEPGLSMEPSTGMHSSESPGALDCEGPVNGLRPTGTGTLSEDGPYGTLDPDSCTSGGEATGTDRLTIPTADGPQQINSEFTATFGKLSNKNGIFGGEFTGTRFTGSFTFTVLEGDCVTTPITKVRVTGDGVIHG